ncbi:MAG: YjbH domain-containing protein [Candidatus Hatepunaea meridiana]|nr:YjbH domain-containing protein [Candidatus Hatepunaea meridiana]
MNEHFTYLIIIVLLAITSQASLASPSLCGYSGLILAPGGEITGDGVLTAGMGYVPPEYAILRGPVLGEKVYFFNLGYLPFFEICIRAIQIDHIGNTWGFGDRSSCLRIRILSERKYIPSMLVGFHDIIGGAMNFRACYAALSKNLHMARNFSLGINIGHGNNLDDDLLKKRKRRLYSLIGLFGGMSFNYRGNLEFVIDYDTRKFNGGIKYCLFKRFNLLVTFLNFESLTGGISYSYQL